MYNIQEIKSMDREYLFQNYGDRLPVAFENVRGPYLIDTDGREYIDFLSGVSVTNIGGDNEAFVRRLHEQIDRIIHSSNWFYNMEQIEAARRIHNLAFGGRTLFVNSGAEANEGAIKLARKYGQTRSEECYHIVVFTKSFHGRTFGAMSATGNEKIRTGFGPLVPGFIYLPFNDRDALKDACSRYSVCAVMTELIQGEGGINPVDADFSLFIQETAREHGALLIVDEIQTGIARTGKYFVYQHFGLEPDIMTLAKGLGNGIPIGAIHARDEIASLMGAGTHGTTFGGNHLASAAAATVLDVISADGFLDNVQALSGQVFDFLGRLTDNCPIIREVRGLGLHIGVELTVEGMPVVKRALQEGLVINCTSGNVLRIMPSLTIDPETLDRGLRLFEHCLREYSS